MAKLEISGLRKSFGRIEVVHGVDFTVGDGEFVSLIGGSGCGKSTLLRMIAGLEEVTSGTISIDGRVINDIEPKDRDIAMVFQNYALYPHLSVAENMGFSLSLRNVPKREAAAAVEEAAALLGLTDYLDRRPKDLSGGQRQRVAMGRAIVRNPRIFLFDEPLSNLDAKLRVQMRLEIKALQRRLGTTSIYVTHDQVEALTMSDRLVLMNEGSVEQIGTPMEVYKRPANLFVATFIGSPSMNLIDAVLTREGEAAYAEAQGLKIPLPACAQAASGTPIKLGVRPEHLHIASAEAPGAGLKMEVAMVETTGAESHAYGKFGRSDITVTLSGEIGLAAGEIIALTADTSLLHVFDAATGLRISQ